MSIHVMIIYHVYIIPSAIPRAELVECHPCFCSFMNQLQQITESMSSILITKLVEIQHFS